jgi:hypothetical protein
MARIGMAFRDWAAGADLMLAEAAGWARPIRFARGTGGHAPVLTVQNDPDPRASEPRRPCQLALWSSTTCGP